MRYIDIKNWLRREHFKFFNAYDHPHFGMCANVDLTKFYPVIKQRKLSSTIAIAYMLSRAANAIPEFRYRIREKKVVEHEIVHPSMTILTDEDLFSFCTFDYIENFSEFAARASERMAYVQEHPTLEDEPGQDNLLFMTAIPWVSFTSIIHPMNLQPADSIPRFAWGKFFKEGRFLKMPLGVQVHHALMDGIHVGRFYTELQNYLHHPEAVLGKA